MALKTFEMSTGTVIYNPEHDYFALKTVNGWAAYLPACDTLSDEDMPSWTPNENVVGTVKT
jgi:hypothetical protein